MVKINTVAITARPIKVTQISTILLKRDCLSLKSLKWKNDGKTKAMGVEMQEPIRATILSNLPIQIIPIKIVKDTRNVLSKLVHKVLLFSQTIILLSKTLKAGLMITGYTTIIENISKSTMLWIYHCVWSRLSNIT
jgi:hypothetical protein